MEKSAEQKSKKSFSSYMRSLHRDIGFFTIGLVVIYALSGILLIYRDTGFLKSEIKVEKKLAPNLETSELGRELHVREVKVIKTEGETIFFENGTYNKATGEAKFTTKEILFPFNKFINLHKSSGKSASHWFTTLFGVVLLFLALSSFWMFKKSSAFFRRGIYFACAGIVVTIILLLI